jgi:abhydrolase domain-containing protein 17
MIKSMLKYLVFPNMEIYQPQLQDPDTLAAIKSLPSSGPIKRQIPYIAILHEMKDVPVAIYYHGNAETLFDVYSLLRNLSSYLQCSIISYEYPGYGLYYSKNKPDECIIYEDAIDVYIHVLNKYARGKPQNIVLIGRSLGSAPAIYTAFINKQVRCLILISPFKSILGTRFTNHYSFDMFKNYKYIEYISAPTLLIHGKKDDIVPFQSSVELFKYLRNPESKIILIDKGTHNNIFSNYFDKVACEIQFYI